MFDLEFDVFCPRLLPTDPFLCWIAERKWLSVFVDENISLRSRIWPWWKYEANREESIRIRGKKTAYQHYLWDEKWGLQTVRKKNENSIL